jgi:hypothetical protein
VAATRSHKKKENLTYKIQKQYLSTIPIHLVKFCTFFSTRKMREKLPGQIYQLARKVWWYLQCHAAFSRDFVFMYVHTLRTSLAQKLTMFSFVLYYVVSIVHIR